MKRQLLLELGKLGACSYARGGEQQLGGATAGLAQVATHLQLTAAKGLLQFGAKALQLIAGDIANGNEGNRSRCGHAEGAVGQEVGGVMLAVGGKG